MEQMKNVKLEKAHPKGWFLTIGEDSIENTWAVTSTELWCVKKIIEDNMPEIMAELEKRKAI